MFFSNITNFPIVIIVSKENNSINFLLSFFEKDDIVLIEKGTRVNKCPYGAPLLKVEFPEVGYVPIKGIARPGCDRAGILFTLTFLIEKGKQRYKEASKGH